MTNVIVGAYSYWAGEGVPRGAAFVFLGAPRGSPMGDPGTALCPA